MSRDLRRVPADWKHPNDERGRLQPKHQRSFREAAAEWKTEYAAWERGERPEYCDPDSSKLEYWEWNGGPPDREYYMPEWTDAERTHFQMYETCSEGTPISPVFDTIEKVARWCADNGASAFGSITATYDEWLATCRQGYSMGLLVNIDTSETISGVALNARDGR